MQLKQPDNLEISLLPQENSVALLTGCPGLTASDEEPEENEHINRHSDDYRERHIRELETENAALRSRTEELVAYRQLHQVSEEKLQRHSRIVNGINMIMDGMLRVSGDSELGHLCLSVAEEITSSSYGFIGELDGDGHLKHIAISAPGWMSCEIISEWGHNQRPACISSGGIFRSILASGKGFFTNSPENHPDHVSLPAGHPPLNAFLGVPLLREGRMAGLIAVAKGSGGYLEEDLKALESIASTVSQAFERKRAEEALRESEERFRIMADGITQMIWVTDPLGRLLFVNRAYREFFGVTLEEVQSTGWQPPVHPDDAAANIGEFHACLTEQRSFRSKTRVRRHDGEWRWIESNGQPRFSATGEFLGMVGSSPDITDHEHTEEELRRLGVSLEQRVEERTADLVRTISSLQSEYVEREQAVRELGEKDRLLIQQSRLAAMGEMINQIAHQWRQPLNVVGMHLQHLLLFYDAGNFDRALLKDSIDSSMKLIQHMSETIEDFRNFFKPDKDRERFCINHAVQQAISLVKGGFTSDYIRIVTKLECDRYIDGYPNEFSQALLNILQNARDALVEREVPNRRIRVAASIQNGRGVVTISDNAGGIPEEIRERIFEPYFSTKGLQGTGIGLFMSKNIIEHNMSGCITVSNNADGAEFRIEI